MREGEGRNHQARSGPKSCHTQSQPLNAAEMVSGKKEGECANEADMLTRSLMPLPLLRHTDVMAPSHPQLPAPKSVVSRN